MPLTVCEVLRALPSLDGKSVAVLGRYSFRERGSWVGEQACDPAVPATPQLMLVEDSRRAPKPPEQYELDGAAIERKMVDVLRRTKLGKFRFGTPDYDRWAVIYGRVQALKPDDAKEPAANLVFRGDGVIVFIRPDQYEPR